MISNISNVIIKKQQQGSKYKKRNWTLVCFLLKQRIQKFYAWKRNRFQFAQRRKDIGVLLCAPRDKHPQMTSWRVMKLGSLSQKETAQKCSFLAKITKNFYVAKSNGFSLSLSYFSAALKINGHCHLNTLCSLGFYGIPLSWLAFSLPGHLISVLLLHNNSWNIPRAWISILSLFFIYTIIELIIQTQALITSCLLIIPKFISHPQTSSLNSRHTHIKSSTEHLHLKFYQGPYT